MTGNDVIAYLENGYMVLHAADTFNGIQVQLYKLVEKHNLTEAEQGVQQFLTRLSGGRICGHDVQGKMFYPYPCLIASEQVSYSDSDAMLYQVKQAETKLVSKARELFRREQQTNGVLANLKNQHRALNGE